ncbi:alpha/beta fold hydrolase [Kocuria turfanensis]|uniref:alpha/beta fold hydrolase n=1 Tax=Kocuria turfanensis TaxID=388357 RepID=UPI00403715BA
MFPQDLADRLASDEELRELGLNTDVSFALAVRGDETSTVTVHDGEVSLTSGETDDAAFTIVLDAEEWARVLASSPAPRTQHVLAFLAPRGTGEVLGDREVFAQHLQLVRRVIELARGADTPAPSTPVSLEGVVGRYLPVEVRGWGACTIYYETAGQGAPVLLLATAGSDTRQYHGLMSDPQVTAQYQLIAFDLPWHGKSNPPAGKRNTDYVLDSQTYTDCIAAVIRALNLPQAPVIVGASMAGAVVVEMAARHPGLLRGVVSSQAGSRVANRHTPWLRNPKINQTLHVPEWTYGLMSPESPKQDRDRVWWGYSQGGFSVYERDIAYYSICWDIDNIAHLLNEHTPPVVLMNGVYDYSVPPAATRELAARIPGAVVREMPELGHFPHAENAPAFVPHLLWALEHIHTSAHVHSTEASEATK